VHISLNNDVETCKAIVKKKLDILHYDIYLQQLSNRLETIQEEIETRSPKVTPW
jgi:hypothetical protein